MMKIASIACFLLAVVSIQLASAEDIKRDYENHGKNSVTNVIKDKKVNRRDYNNWGDRATFNDHRYGGKRDVESVTPPSKRDYNNWGDRATFNDHRFGGKRDLQSVLPLPNLEKNLPLNQKRDYENYGSNPTYQNFSGSNFPINKIDSRDNVIVGDFSVPFRKDCDDAGQRCNIYIDKKFSAEYFKMMNSTNKDGKGSIINTADKSVFIDMRNNNIFNKRDYNNWGDRATFNDHRFGGKRDVESVTPPSKRDYNNWGDRPTFNDYRFGGKRDVESVTQSPEKRDYNNWGDRATFNDWRYGGKRDVESVTQSPVKRDYTNYGDRATFNDHRYGGKRDVQSVTESPVKRDYSNWGDRATFNDYRFGGKRDVESVTQSPVKRDYTNYGDRATFNDHRYGGKRDIESVTESPVKRDYNNWGDRATFNDYRFGGKREINNKKYDSKRFDIYTDRPNINRNGGSGYSVDCDDFGQRCNYNIGK